ncbi:putative polyadenylate-binding protein [Acorus gramineus]|uniref:Polyadenylate-binding protein n=1 Tax=Acorus gramineus TaxID=55184 RepID=A0AAV9AJM4_ACOGR|nr:putative polyadenylate-binding protein [Acorus gramineus]
MAISTEPSHVRSPTLYVGDLHPSVAEPDLASAFSPFGDIASVRVCRDRRDNASLRFAYVNFLSHESASKALRSLNHTPINGKPMRIMWSQRDPYLRKAGIGNLFVKNLDSSMGSADLEEMFGRFGTIVSCKVAAEDDGRSKGFGFVQFESEESACAAIKELDGSLTPGNKRLYVSKFVKKSERHSSPVEPSFTNLYVKNFSPDTTNDGLQNMFSEFGKVQSASVMIDSEGNSRGFGFVNFQSSEDAKKAIERMNGMQIGLNTLYVGKAQNKSERSELLKHKFANQNCPISQGFRLYVKNIDESVDDEEFKNFFLAYGKVISAKVMRTASGRGRGFGYVYFFSLREAYSALHACHGTLFHGRPLYVVISKPKENHIIPYPTYHEYYHIPSYNTQPTTNKFFGVVQNQSYQQRQFQQLQMQRQVNSWTNNHPYVPQYDYDAYSMNPAQYMDPQKPVGYENYQGSGWHLVKKQIITKHPKEIVGMQKPDLRNLLYKDVQKLEPELAKEITRVLMELKYTKLIGLLRSPKALNQHVKKAAESLKPNANAKLEVVEDSACESITNSLVAVN